MWLKYSANPIDCSSYMDRAQRPHKDDYRSDYEKPVGCWITDDSDNCWRSWCEGEQFSLESLTHKHEVILDESNILILRCAGDLDYFTEEYGGDCRWGPAKQYVNRYIDWHKVAARHDGLIITPYIWRRRMELNWYYPWDCASGCIWKAQAIKGIRLLEISEVATRKTEGAELAL